ncbi:MAG: hypothetical protein HQL13_05965 [Candidatus Omnitrophica bacterium]|nr:hypothetical protein [Candidatus Omnitrophota bacterium]
MLESDYLSAEKHQAQTNDIGKSIVREVVIPQLTKEINEGKNFAELRQVYNSLILAAWYKKKIKDSILSQIYADKNKIAGVNIDDPQEKQHIYERYLQAFKKGAYNYIREEQEPLTQKMIPKKYFSGGITALHFTEGVMVVSPERALAHKAMSSVRDLASVEIILGRASNIQWPHRGMGIPKRNHHRFTSKAMISMADYINSLSAEDLRVKMIKSYKDKRMNGGSLYQEWQKSPRKRSIVSGGFILRKVNIDGVVQWAFLMGQRGSEASDRKGLYVFPIGKIDNRAMDDDIENNSSRTRLLREGLMDEEDFYYGQDKESVLGAGVREIREESGLRFTISDVVGRVQEFSEHTDGWLCHYGIFIDESDVEPRSKKNDLINFKWVPISVLFHDDQTNPSIHVSLFLHAPVMIDPKRDGFIRISEFFKQVFGLDVSSNAGGDKMEDISLRLASKNNAQLAVHDFGGMDFKLNKLNLQLQNRDNLIRFKVDSAMLARLQHAPGFTISRITVKSLKKPLENLSEFLGLDDPHPHL